MATFGYIAKASGFTPSGRAVSYSSGPANTAAEATAELLTKLALVVVNLKPGGIQVSYTDDSVIPVTNTSGAFEEATLVVQKLAGSGQLFRKPITIENVGLEYKASGINNKAMVITDTDLTTFATAYRDGAGAGGYTLVSGTYAR